MPISLRHSVSAGLTTALFATFVLLVSLTQGALAEPAPTRPRESPPVSTDGGNRGNVVELGLPAIRNFDPIEYGGEPQTWAIAQDHQGIIYVGNTEVGVLAFNGTTWRAIPLPNLSTVRALATDASGRIFVGAVGELGYLAPDDAGQMRYVSLLDRIPRQDREFKDVWQVLPSRDGVYFRTATLVIRLRGDRITVWNSSTSFQMAFWARGSLFVREVDRGLMQLVGDQLVLVPGGERFATEKIYALLPWGESAASVELLIGTRTQGWFVFDGSRYRAWPTQADAALQRDQIYRAIWLADGTLAVATVQGGVTQLDDHGRLLRHLTKANGLADDVVYALFQDRQGGLWLGLNNGVAWVNVSSPLTQYDTRLGLDGSVHALRRHAGTLYAGTAKGLFRLDTHGDESARFVPIPQVTAESWAMLPFHTSLLVASTQGVFEIGADQIALVRASEHAAGSLLHSDHDPTRVFVGLQDGIASMHWENDRWIDEGAIPGITDDTTTMFEEPDGRLWLGNNNDGVIRLTFPRGWKGNHAAGAAVRVERFGSQDGLPVGGVNVYPIGGKPRFSGTSGELFQFDQVRGRFVPDLRFAALFPAGSRQVLPAQGTGGRVWMATTDRASRLKEAGAAVADVNGRYRWMATPLQPMSGSNIEVIYGDADGIVWFGGTKGLFRYDTGAVITDDPRFTALVHKVTGRDGRPVFGGTRQAGAPQINYGNNALRIDFAAPSYDMREATRFQVLLEGLDPAWSTWTSDTYREYTNIPEGDYRFRVRARNAYGRVSAEATFPFRILPPWYRTWLAYLAFAMLIVAMLWLAYHWWSGALRRRNIELAGLVDERTNALAGANAALSGANDALATANHALLEQSVTDPLTGLRNRRFLLSHIGEDIALVNRRYQSGEATRISNSDLIFLMVDIDHFKEVNDLYGHDAGDRVLEQMRDILLAGCRESDTPVRWGGEEFLVVGRFTDRMFAATFAERIRSMVANHAFVLSDGQTLYRTCSIGFACYPFFTHASERLTWQEVVSLADQCLYAAKHSGRNAWIGVQSTNQAPGDDFSARVYCGLASLVKEGTLRITTSLKDGTDVQWD